MSVGVGRRLHRRVTDDFDADHRVERASG